ncbi:histidinol-phosphate transaminase [Thalassotalea mangrovi]|uniref:Histidinol-phosphate aminotransferase n=1 Tax=Thalassotalea mangrovi TaxID=2572245 RepID=A0A4U1B3D4_9GAMM|nr:histidinol-phosphate transaminase [Thalassotalea mangrovi]TKB43656.1 histidinol-phosphate transaminase [Thalassotalea mangrovi]
MSIELNTNLKNKTTLADTNKSILNLVRKDVIDMVAYQSARREQSGGTVWLNANEQGGNKVFSQPIEQLNRYPDFQPSALINAYANYARVKTEQLLATRGADEAIEVLIRTFCEPGKDNIVICPPTYGMYAISAKGHLTNTTNVPLTSALQLDLEGLQQQVGQCKLVFICSPNNPTGDLINRQDIIHTLEMFSGKALVVVDEAYIDYCVEASCVELLEQFENLVILRTLSKAFGLAGLRCGFAIANPQVIEMMSKIIAPYPIAKPVADIASGALSCEATLTLQRDIKRTLELRNEIVTELKVLPWIEQVFTSKANFVLFRIAATETCERLFAFMSDNGVLIRNQSKQLTLENCLRVSIGSEQELSEFTRLLAAFNEKLS